MNARLSTLCAVLFMSFNLLAQNARFSAELTGGIPINFASIPTSLSTFGGLGIRYNITKEFSLQGHFSVGSLLGKQEGGTTYLTPDNLANYKSFNNTFMFYSVNGQLNLERIFGLRPYLKRLNPYLVAGMGRINSDITANRIINTPRSYDADFYVSYVGLNFRYYINPQLDFVFGSNINFTETYYLDGIPTDQNYDKFLLNTVGINYKIGAKSQKQHIEWNNVILKDRMYAPDIERRNGQPIDEEGNYIVYSKDSVSRLIALNQSLQAQNQAQREDIERQRKEIDSLKTKVDELNREVDTLKLINQQIIERLNSQGQQPIQQIQPNVQQPVKQQQQTQQPASTDNNGVKNEPKTVVPNSNNAQPNPVVAEPVKETPNKATPTQATPTPTPTPTKATPQTNTGVVKQEESVSPVAVVSGLNEIDGVVAPVARYNVIVATYSVTKYATIMRDKLRKKGYEVAAFRSSANSKMVRVCAFSTDNKQEALKMMRKIRADFEPNAWIHIYNK